MRRLRLPCLLFLALGAACSDSDDVAIGEAPVNTPETPSNPSPPAAPSTSPIVDGGPTDPPDACADGGCAPKKGCAAHPAADFCDDFDSADALMPGKTKWDFVEPTEQPVATLSSTRAVSAPSSILSRIIDGTTPGAKYAKTITKAGFTEAKWEYDIYLDNVGTTNGFFLDDFQFSDTAGPDTYGFRLVAFAKDGGFEFLRVEHNTQVTGGDYAIEPAVEAGVIQLGRWHHFAQTVTFTFGEENLATYTLAVDGATAFTKVYAGPPRAAATFARIAALAFVFNKADSAGLAIHWDDHVLELK